MRLEMNRVERRAEMRNNKNNKANSKREREVSMKSMKVVNEVKAVYKELKKSFGLKGHSELPDELIIVMYNHLLIEGSAKEYVKLMVLKDDFQGILQGVFLVVDKIKGSPQFIYSNYFSRDIDAFIGMCFAIAVKIVKEKYAEGILQEIISEVQEYELIESAEERMGLICTLVIPEEEMQAIKTLQAMLSGDAQAFVDELDEFEAMLGIQR